MRRLVKKVSFNPVTWRVSYFAVLAVVLLLVNIVSGFLIWRQWKSYDRELFGETAKYAAAKIYRKNYTPDVDEFLLSLERLESKCALYAAGRIDKSELNLHRRQIVGHYSIYSADTEVGNAIRKQPQFAQANQAVVDFLNAAKSYEVTRDDAKGLFKLSANAIEQWETLRSDVYVTENVTRQELEDGSRMAFQSVERDGQWIALLYLFLIASSTAIFYLAYRNLQSERKRISDFEYVVEALSHDLRSPLQSAQSAAQLLLDRNDAFERRRYHGIINTSIASISKLIDDIASVVRGAEIGSNPSRVEIIKWFDDFNGMYEVKAKSKGLAYTSKFCGNVSVAIIDPDKLTQCLGNLVDNSIKYTKVGSIRVDLTANIVGEKEPRGLLHFVIADSGRGIAKEERAKVFEPFFRGSAPATLHVGGLGLGLSIFKNMTEVLGGTFELSSEIDKGTTFEVIFPVIAQDVVSASIDPHTSVTSTELLVLKPHYIGPIDILIVDDDPLICSTTADILHDIGCNATVAASAADALATLRKKPHAVVITDINMPSMHGVELVKRIRAEFTPIPYIISMSAKRHDLDSNEFKNIFDYSLGKPLSVDQLVNAIRQSQRKSLP